MLEGALNNNRNLISLEAKTSEELSMMIANLVLPTKIVSIVYDVKNEMHVAYLLTSRRVIKKYKKE